MVNKPDLMPSAPGNRWLAYIQLFDFEIVHVPAEWHRGPNGLSRRRKSDDDSTDSESDSDNDIEDKNMFVHTLRQISEVFEINTLELDKDEYDYKAVRTLIGARLDRPFGEALPLETPWDLTFDARSVEGNCHLLEGKAIYFELNSSYTVLDRSMAIRHSMAQTVRAPPRVTLKLGQNLQ